MTMPTAAQGSPNAAERDSRDATRTSAHASPPRDRASASRCRAGGEPKPKRRAMRQRSRQIRAGQGGAARAVARGTECRSRHARDRTRIDRQSVGRALRHRARRFEPGAREKLARISGSWRCITDLRLEVEGHTDDVGTDDPISDSQSDAGSRCVRISCTGDCLGHRRHDRAWRDQTGRHQQHGGRPSAQSARRAHRVRREYRHALT